MEDTEEKDAPNSEYILALFSCLKCKKTTTRRYGRLYKAPQLCLKCEGEERSRYIYMCLKCREFASIPLENGYMKQGCIYCNKCCGDTPEQLEKSS